MISLPLMINDVILKVTINFKNVEIKKDRLDSGAKDVKESDIVIGKTHLKPYEDSKKPITDPKAITDFIRRNINYGGKNVNYIEVNTKKYKDKDFYDTYIIPIPNYKPNEINDYIYGMLVNNIRLSSPDRIKKTNISLADIGFDELFNGEFYNKIASVKGNNPNSLYIRNSLMNAGCEKQLEILDFFNNLDYEISKNSDVILTDELDTVNSFFKDSNKINNFLTNYKNIAISNYDSYMYLAALNTIVNGRNLEWPVLSEEQQKILIKKLNSNSRAA
ncbi:MAG TPA: hypothetical protein IAB59_00400 [Candidatus Onthousia faecipullorum]|uniref:Uncharacterized protein n=1 Tax=Candidatus Onthousia faecipullorum TaxID=2840887 RepID=A0A9D1G9K2_9FIRM|nr:hypothetical protein [Candidatus Onthousia faecipullorum]